MIEKIPRWIKVLFLALSLAFLIEWFGAMGFWGFIALVLLFTIIRGIKMRDSIMQVMKYTETAIWKKPLDKDLWDKNELKNTKVKVKWRQKHGQ